MKNLGTVIKHQDYMVSVRRFLHENPELSGQEYNTIKFIESELKKQGIEYIEIENGGVLGFIDGAKKTGKTVLLRADCDALPIQEKNNLAGTKQVWSKKDGIMHACGHDAHTAILLGAAKVLQEKRNEFEGTVILCFERGEELTGNVKYIFSYMEKNGIHVDSCFGMHTNIPLQTGKVAINDTNSLAGAYIFDITIEGKGGHGSRPDQAENPIDCFVAIYQRMQSLRLTKINPFTPMTYSVGKLSCSLQSNVIPQSLNFGGTARYFDDTAGLTFKKEFEQLVKNMCATYNCRATFNTVKTPGVATINDCEYAAFARKIFAQELGEENVSQIDPVMGSESFGKYLKQWPGCYGFLGVHNANKGTGAGNHNEQFDIDEDALSIGATCYVTYALEFLKSNMKNTYVQKCSFSQLLRLLGQDEDLKELY